MRSHHHHSRQHAGASLTTARTASPAPRFLTPETPLRHVQDFPPPVPVPPVKSRRKVASSFRPPPQKHEAARLLNHPVDGQQVRQVSKFLLSRRPAEPSGEPTNHTAVIFANQKLHE